MLGPRLDGPVAALARIILWPLLLDEALVETEVVSDAVLPAGVVSPVVREGVRNPLVDLGQG